MTRLLAPAGRPSPLHEARVETLATLAALSGFEGGPDVLLDGTRPDVLLMRLPDQSLFIGDAKATETPGNADTHRRLSHYTDFLATWTARGHAGVFALAVEPSKAYRWLRVLRDLSQVPSGGETVLGNVCGIDSTTAIIWQSFAGRPNDFTGRHGLQRLT